MKAQVIDVLNTIYDPEIPVNIWELGFIYKLEVNENNDVYILMTLTAPNCPAADFIMEDIHMKVESIHGVNKVDVELVFEPEWTTDRMSEEAKLDLGML